MKTKKQTKEEAQKGGRKKIIKEGKKVSKV
jgi:hypothetical protein